MLCKPISRAMATVLRAVLCLACLLASNSLSQSQHNNETDQAALLSFKSMISDDPLYALASWNSSFHACQWHGIVCKVREGQRRVTALYLNSLNLAGTISPSLANLTFLKKLSLPGNRLRGLIPQQLGFLPHLQHLNLSFNSLQGGIPSTLCQSSSLQNISLSNNMLQGEIPQGLNNCSRLQFLSLMNNSLTGQASVSNLSVQLEWLALGGNKISGSIPPGIANLVNLKAFQMNDNLLAGTIPASLGRLFALISLRLSSNLLTGAIPPSLWNLSFLVDLSLYRNQLHGSLPSNIGQRLPKLRVLLLYENQFHGHIPMSLSNASSLRWLELNGNEFSGKIPQSLGTLRNLSRLLLYKNQLEAKDSNEWSFLTALMNCTNLQLLALHDNMLGGILPGSVANFSARLEGLSLAFNQISGTLPQDIGNLAGLTVLSFGKNFLRGMIPATISRIQGLHVIDLYGNKFSGEIPYSLGNLTQLNKIFLGENELHGVLPTSLGNCWNLDTLDLNYNKLSGTIPREVLAISTLSLYLDLARNSFTGPLPSEVGNLRNLQKFDVSYNNLSGGIPNDLRKCQILEYLYMEGNFFSGPIPLILRDLKGLRELDLSDNNLSGSIPVFLGGLSLSYLNLSFNDLEGEVPQGGIFADPTAFSILGNKRLCGNNTDLNLPPCSARASPRRNLSAKITIIISVISVTLCLVLLFCFILLCRMRKSRKQYSASMSIKGEPTRLSYVELLKATNGFSSANLIGVGNFGSVYKGILNQIEQQVVAVKVLNLQQQGASKSFIVECEALRSVRHRNLVKILTACSTIDLQGNDFKALVFEFLPNGSLEEWLHPEEEELDNVRKLTLIECLNIAIDVASAVEYLHHHGTMPIIHCDLKPSNVLLDENMTAHVCDFGLAKFLVSSHSRLLPSTTSSIQLTGSIGYVAPEYGMGNEASTHGDVYSYGILLLEMLTGRRPTDDAFKDGLDLHKFVEMAFPDQIIEVINSYLIREEEDEEDEGNIGSINDAKERAHRCILSLLRIGIKCSKKSPQERMQMGEVTKELHAIRDVLVQHRVNHVGSIQNPWFGVAES